MPIELIGFYELENMNPFFQMWHVPNPLNYLVLSKIIHFFPSPGPLSWSSCNREKQHVWLHTASISFASVTYKLDILA